MIFPLLLLFYRSFTHFSLLRKKKKVKLTDGWIVLFERENKEQKEIKQKRERELICMIENDVMSECIYVCPFDLKDFFNKFRKSLLLIMISKNESSADISSIFN